MSGPDSIEVFVNRQRSTGAFQMACDEILLQRAINEAVGHFRMFEWSAPTVSLGYFQEYDPLAIPQELRSLDVVRRLSGGGAILHHHELTYSSSIPAAIASNLGDPSQLYVTIHHIIQEALADQGFVCDFRGVPKSFPHGEPFLCYSRGDERDLVCGADKIVGSAQRRRKGAILQHGSILLRQSEYAPQFPGVNDLSPSSQPDIDEIALSAGILERVASLFQDSVKKAHIPQSLIEQAHTCEAEKYRFPGKKRRHV